MQARSGKLAGRGLGTKDAAANIEPHCFKRLGSPEWYRILTHIPSNCRAPQRAVSNLDLCFFTRLGPYGGRVSWPVPLQAGGPRRAAHPRRRLPQRCSGQQDGENFSVDLRAWSRHKAAGALLEMKWTRQSLAAALEVGREKLGTLRRVCTGGRWTRPSGQAGDPAKAFCDESVSGAWIGS